MDTGVLRVTGWMLVLGLALWPAAARADGRIEGRVTATDGTGLGGVTVAIDGTTTSTLTDSEGRFAFRDVHPGTFSITLALGTNTLTVENVRVDENTVNLERTVDWKVGFAETVTTYAAFRRTERLFEAPASVSVLTAQAIGPEAATAQLPKVLESAVGLEITQSGIFDFNVNIRGLNSSLNRRVLTLVDGRDPASVLIGAQEWATFALPIDEIATIEIVRGPGSALYGTNAFNGVIDIISKEPKYAQGGNVQFSVGEVGTTRLSARHGGALGRNWFYRAQTGFGRTDDFFVSRHGAVEYLGLPMEASTPARDHTTFVNAGARLDHYQSNDSRLTVEGGWARADGNMFVTGAGRLQSLGSQRPWLRSAVQSAQWRVAGYYDGRSAQMLSLAPGSIIFDDSSKVNVEVQRRFDYASGRGRLVAGGVYRYERADTRDGSGVSTILRDVEAAHEQAAFGQLDHSLRDDLTLVVAARFDNSTLHGPEVSPKVGLVYATSPTQGLRVTYSHAFETGSFVHYFTHAAAAPPLQLGAVESALKPFLGGVALGLDRVPILALGNDHLGVERVDSFEAGYSGVIGRRVILGADYYFNRITNLITPLLPQVGTELGRINPTYGSYHPPSVLTPQQQALVLATLQTALPPSVFASLSNDLDGSPIIAAVSYTNFARVNLQGAEFNVQYFPSDRLLIDAGYSTLAFQPKRALTQELISANAPPHRVTASVTHTYKRLTTAVHYRWTDEFTWSGGVFKGPVPAATVVDLTSRYKFGPRTAVVANVANLFNDRHYEIFGGDLLRRRALVTIVQNW